MLEVSRFPGEAARMPGVGGQPAPPKVRRVTGEGAGVLNFRQPLAFLASHKKPRPARRGTVLQCVAWSRLGGVRSNGQAIFYHATLHQPHAHLEGGGSRLARELGVSRRVMVSGTNGFAPDSSRWLHGIGMRFRAHVNGSKVFGVDQRARQGVPCRLNGNRGRVFVLAWHAFFLDAQAVHDSPRVRAPHPGNGFRIDAVLRDIRPIPNDSGSHENASTNCLARSTVIFFSFTMASATRSINLFAAPPSTAIFLACSFMWPRWMPSVARARMAAKFWANPTEAMTSPSSCAVFTPKSLTFIFAMGWVFVAPPTKPTARGNSIFPFKWPSRVFS